MEQKRIIVALTGASGIQYGVEVIKALIESEIDTHVILSEWATHVLKQEIGVNSSGLNELDCTIYDHKDMNTPISSSSTLMDGMVVIPATVKTVSNIATANTGNLISRAADITLRMRRTLVVCIR